MAGRKLNIAGAYAASLMADTHFPYLAGQKYVTGRQPFSPGETQSDSGGPTFQLVPWPNIVPSLLALANFPGRPQAPGLAIVNNSQAMTPNNSLFISGFVGKSRG